MAPPPDELADDVRNEARWPSRPSSSSPRSRSTWACSANSSSCARAVEGLCHELAAEYEEQGRGFQLVWVAGGWRFQTYPEQAPYIERFVLEGQHAKLSAAALETLAIVAYKQPDLAAQVASIRGGTSTASACTLQHRGYIAEVARDTGPGQPVLFGTTRAFLEQLGLDSLDGLPPIGDFAVPGADVVEQLEHGLRPGTEPLSDELARIDDADADGTQPGDDPDDGRFPGLRGNSSVHAG